MYNIDKLGIIIANRSGASIADVDALITNGINRSNTKRTPDHVVVHLGTNDTTYKKTAAPLVTVK